MAKIIQIIDVGSDGTHVRLNDGSFVTLDHNAGWSPSIGDEVPHVEKSGTPTNSPRPATTESRPPERRKVKGSTPRMKHRGEEREDQLSGLIEASEMSLRERIQELAQVKGKRRRNAAEKAFQHEAATLRQEINEVAANAATEGVREFGNALLVSQGRLSVHAGLLRNYTACLVTEIRNKLSTSDLFKTALRLPWQQDPTTQKAIQTCEEILSERCKIGDGLPYGANELNGSDTGIWVRAPEWLF